MAKPAAVLFDLDGCLVDTAEDFVLTIEAMCLERQIPMPTKQQIRERVSDGARALVKLCFPKIDPESGRFTSQLEEFLQRYGDHLGRASAPYPQIRELLEELAARDIAWGVVTNKPRRFAEPLLAQLRLTPEVLVCRGDCERAKPDPEPLRLACKQLQLEPERTVYIGDHRRDIECGRAAGAKTIAVAYGYTVPGEDPAQWGAEHLAADVTELRAILRALSPANETASPAPNQRLQ